MDGQELAGRVGVKSMLKNTKLRLRRLPKDSLAASWTMIECVVDA